MSNQLVKPNINIKTGRPTDGDSAKSANNRNALGNAIPASTIRINVLSTRSADIADVRPTPTPMSTESKVAESDTAREMRAP